MQPVTLVLILLVLVMVGLAAGLIWLRWRNRAASGPILPRAIPARPATALAALAAPEPALAALVIPEPIIDAPAEPPAPTAAPSPKGFVLDLSDAPVDDGEEMDEARPVIPTALIIVWVRAGHPAERWHVTVDSVSQDTFAFAGTARRLDVIQVVARRHVFHTLPFAHDRLVTAEDAEGAAIMDIRAWLAALADAVGEEEKSRPNPSTPAAVPG